MVSSSRNTRSWGSVVIHHQRSILVTSQSLARPISTRIQTCPPRCSHWIIISTKHSRDLSLPPLNKMRDLVFIVQHSTNQAPNKYQSHQVLFGKSSHPFKTKWTNRTRWQPVCKFMIIQTLTTTPRPGPWPGTGTKISRYSAAMRWPARGPCPDPLLPWSLWPRAGTPWPRWAPAWPRVMCPWSVTMSAVTLTCPSPTRDSAQSDWRPIPRRRLQSTSGKRTSAETVSMMTPSLLRPLTRTPPLAPQTPARTC